MKPTKKLPLWIKIILGITILCITLFVLWFGSPIIFWRISDLKTSFQQGVTIENFNKEIARVPSSMTSTKYSLVSPLSSTLAK